MRNGNGYLMPHESGADPPESTEPLSGNAKPHATETVTGRNKSRPYPSKIKRERDSVPFFSVKY